MDICNYCESKEFYVETIPDAIEFISKIPKSITVQLPNRALREYHIIHRNSELEKLQKLLWRAKQEGRNAIRGLEELVEKDISESKYARKTLDEIDITFKNWVKSSGLTLRSILPENHHIFNEFEINKTLEKSRPNVKKEIAFLEDLAGSRRKFSSQTRKWLKHKSPFMKPEFKEKLKLKNWWTKNSISILDETLEEKRIICLECGSIIRTYFDIQSKLLCIKDLLQIQRTATEFLDKYDSAMANWIRDDKIIKEKAKKIRTEKKLQAELEKLEAQRKSAEEKLRKLQDE